MGGQLTVAELIAELQKCPQDARVVLNLNDAYNDTTSVYETRRLSDGTVLIE